MLNILKYVLQIVMVHKLILYDKFPHIISDF